MATVDKPKLESRISSEALDLLHCFSGDLDEMVYAIAEDVARKRQQSAVAHAQAIEIGADDVRSAGAIVIELLDRAVRDGNLPNDLIEQFDCARRCFERKAH